MNTAFSNIAKKYKRTIPGCYILVDGANLTDKISGTDFFVTKKLDGIMTVMFMRGGSIEAYNSGGNELPADLPCFSEAARMLRALGMTEATVAGELHITLAQDGRERVCDVSRALADPLLRYRLRFAPFNILEESGVPIPAKHYQDIHSQLCRIFKNGVLVAPVEGRQASGKGEVEQIYREWVVDGGSEGLVVYSENPMVYKVKPRHSIDAVIIGYTEGEDARKGMIRDLLLAVMHPDGKLQQIASVGTGFSDAQRVDFYERLSKLHADSEYIETDSRNVAFQMVAPEIVVEFNAVDLVTENAAGEPKLNMLLEYDYKEGFRISSRVAGVSAHSPVFLRERSDKTACPEDVKIRQLTDTVEFSSVKTVDFDSLPKSKVLMRRVFMKEVGVKRMVQKFLVWKTNKEHTGRFPAYVLHHTDYNFWRQDTLKRDIRVSDSYEQIMQLYQDFIDASIKKGWYELTPNPLTV
ncbi:MAG: hypothetical protein NC248_12135 [Bacteroides sp.]|nr:hypothetical protein [Muribaculum sp.]MCM1333343.1 hypothetical protein [Bacteroides sp.]